MNIKHTYKIRKVFHRFHFFTNRNHARPAEKGKKSRIKPKKMSSAAILAPGKI